MRHFGTCRYLSLARLLCTLVACVLASVASFAADKTYPGLTDGMEILSAYSGAHPKAQEAFDRLLERAPPEVQKKVRSSDWAEQQRNMTSRDLFRAAGDDDLTLLPTADGLAAIPTDKIEEGLNALTDFAIDQPETADFLETIRDKVPDKYKPVIEKISDQLDALRKARESGQEGLAEQAKRIAIKGTVSVIGNSLISDLSNRIRNEVNSGNARTVLDKYKDQAAERRRKAAGKIAAAEADRKRQASEADKAARERREQEALDDLKTKAVDALGAHDKMIAGKTALVGQCENIRATIPPTPSLTGGPGTIEGAIEAQKNLDDAIRAANATGAWENLIRMISDAAHEAAAACADPAAYVDKGGTKDALGTKMDVARGVHEAIRSEIDKAMSALDKPPFDRAGFEKFISDAKAFRDYCNKNKTAGADMKGKLSLSPSEKKLQARLIAYEQFLAGMGKISDLEILGIRARLANQKTKIKALDGRANRCLDALNEMARDCDNKVFSDVIANEGKIISDFDALDARRAAARQTLTDFLDKVNDAYSDAKTAIQKGRACVDNAGTDQAKCDEEAIKAAYADANAAYLNENYGLARQKIEAILAKYAGCPGITDKFTRDDALIDTMVGGDVKVDTAIKACDVPRLKRQIGIINNAIAKIDSGRTRALPRTKVILQRWIARIEAAVETCTQVASAAPGAGTGAGGGSSPGGAGTGSGTTTTPTGGAGGGTSGGGPAIPPNCTTAPQAAPGTKTFNMMTGPATGGGPRPSLDPRCGGPCPFLANWSLPPNARCLDSPGANTQPTGPTGSQTATSSSPSAPVGSSTSSSGGGAKSDCGPPVKCTADPRCHPVAYQCINGEWIGGHCVCPPDVFGN